MLSQQRSQAHEFEACAPRALGCATNQSTQYLKLSYPTLRRFASAAVAPDPAPDAPRAECSRSLDQPVLARLRHKPTGICRTGDQPGKIPRLTMIRTAQTVTLLSIQMIQVRSLETRAGHPCNWLCRSAEAGGI